MVDVVAARSRPRVVVVGGGISGLAAAWRLSAGPDAPEVVVLEGGAVFGGLLRRGELDGVVLDLGAESVLVRRPEAVALMREAGLAADVVHPATTSASVWSRGRLHPMPAGTLMGVPGGPAGLRPLLTDPEVGRLVAEEIGPPLEADVDVASWVTGRVGPAVLDRLVEPLLGGVYAGRADRLSLQATMPQLWPVARRGGSLSAAVQAVNAARPATSDPVFAGLRGGIARLPEQLVARLGERGVVLRTSSTVRALRRTPSGWQVVVGPTTAPEHLDADAVVLAVPSAPAARLLAGEVPAAAAELSGFETASVAVVAALVPRASLAALPGSGVLVPPVETASTSGVKAVTVSSQKWAWVHGQPGADPARALVRLSLGRFGEEAVLQRDDGDLARLAVDGLERMLGRPAPARAVLVQRWGGGLPQYTVGHVDRVARVRVAVAVAGRLAVCGAWLDGVGVPACVAAAGVAAEGVLGALGVSLPE